MRKSYSKNYFEKYASLTIADVLQVNVKDIMLSDRPDIRIFHANWGIEVTQALTPEEAVADVKKPLYTLFDLNPFDHHHDDIESMLQKIKDAIERKENKSKHYESYLHNGLYIFTHCLYLDSQQLKEYLDCYSFQTDFYEYLFFNCVTTIYQYHIPTHELKAFSFGLKQLQSMNQCALLYEKTCRKKRRQIIIK